MASKKDKYLESAQRFMLKGQLDKAIKDYQQVVALEPKEIRYRQKLAELLVKDNRKEEAIAEYADIGKHYADNSYFLKAIAVYKQIQRLSPANLEISLTLASLNHKQGLIGNALAEYGQVVAQMEKNGALRDALKVLEEMLQIDADQGATRLKYAELLFATGAEDASYQAFSSLLKYLQARGEAVSAQRVAERIAKLFPRHAEQNLDLVAEQLAAGDVDEALAALQRWVKRDSRDAQAWQLLCEAQRRKGDLAGLRHSCGQMLDLFPDDAAVLKGAVRCEMEAGAPRRAFPILERHLPRFIERGQLLSMDELLDGFPPQVAEQLKGTEWLQGFYRASGGAGSPDQSPCDFDPSAVPLQLADGDPHSEAAGELQLDLDAGAPAEGEELPLPWEEEIDLDLDDNLHMELPPVHEVGVPLDFALPADEEPEPVEQVAEAHSYGDLSFLSEPSELPEPEQALELELHDAPLELTLPDDSEAFPDFAWGEPAGEELEQAEEALQEQTEAAPEEHIEDALEEHLEEALEEEPVEVPLEEHLEIAEPHLAEAAPQPSRGWEEIYPEADAAGGDLDLGELESHYDLGVGYKEMGMYDGAIRELQLAAQNPQRRLACLTLQAMCYREKGEVDTAKELLQRGLGLDVLSRDERVTLRYELAYLLEGTGAVDQAVVLYREVHKESPEFHDVGTRLFELTGEEPHDIIELEMEDV